MSAPSLPQGAPPEVRRRLDACVRLADVMAHQVAIHPSARSLFGVAPDLPVPGPEHDERLRDWFRILQVVSYNALARS